MGRDDSVLCGPDGNLAEGPGYNIWVVNDGVCATPDANCLLGMSRKSAIELCEMEGIPCETRVVHPDELRGADEAFVTSSAGGILPVTAIDDKPLGNGAPGHPDLAPDEQLLAQARRGLVRHEDRRPARRVTLGRPQGEAACSGRRALRR